MKRLTISIDISCYDFFPWTAYLTNFDDRISGSSCNSDLLPRSRHGIIHIHVPVILRLTHRDMLRSPKFLSRVSLPLPYGHPNPSFQLLFRPSLSHVHSVLSVVMLRDCCYQRSDGNRQSIDAGRMSCSG